MSRDANNNIHVAKNHTKLEKNTKMDARMNGHVVKFQNICLVAN